jgi:hypothetical protein
MDSNRQNELNDMEPVQSRLSLWKLTLRIIGVVLITVLTVCLVISTLTAPRALTQLPLLKEAVLYTLLFLFNSMIFVPTIFEVRMAQASADKLLLKTLFWQVTLDWKDVIEFHNPHYLRVAILRTARCIYLFHKKDLTNYGQLEQIIKLKA